MTSRPTNAMRAFGSKKHRSASQVTDAMLRAPVLSISSAPGDAFSAPLGDSNARVVHLPMTSHGAVIASQRPHKSEVKIVLKKRSSMKLLGFEALPDGGCLQICRVSNGLLHRYNKAHPETAACAGDHIVAINGRMGNAAELADLLRSEDALEMTVAKADKQMVDTATAMDMDDSDDCNLLSLKIKTGERRPTISPLKRSRQDDGCANVEPSFATPERVSCLRRRQRPRRQRSEILRIEGGAVICCTSPATPSASSTSQPGTPEELTQEMPRTPEEITLDMPRTPEEIAREVPRTPKEIAQEMALQPIALEPQVIDSLAPPKTSSDVAQMLPQPLVAPMDQEEKMAPQSVAPDPPVTDSLAPSKTLSDIMRILPRPLAAPTDQESHLYQFWNFVAQSLLGSKADDNVCRAFKLGGSIDQLSDVAFSRDHIIARFGRTDDLHSIVWHHMLICWLGAGGPQQKSYKWLCTQGLAKGYSETDSALVGRIYASVEALARRHGFSSVFDGDSRAVKFRLDAKQQGEPVLQSWFKAVPQLVMCLRKGIAPDHLDRELRSVFYVGELTAKELFVLLSYARPAVADTVRYMPVGPGARDGAVMVLSSEAEACCDIRPAAPVQSKAKGKARRTMSDGLEAMRMICGLQEWAMQNIPRLAKACEDYRASAPHRNDPVRNCRTRRPHLFDLADIEVMLCYYKNYVKMRRRFGNAEIPPGVSVRGWERRL